MAQGGNFGGQRGNRQSQLRKIFIGGLNYNSTEESLKSHFSQYGELVDVVVMKFQDTKRSRGFGFVTFSTDAEVDACQEARPHTIDGKMVETKRATPREEFGKPEAGQTVKKVFVGGLKEDMEESDLRTYFEQFGPVVAVTRLTDKDTGKPRGFGFIEFDDYDPVDKAILKGSHQIKGRRVDVKKAVSKQEMNSMGGGGGPGGGMGRGGGRRGGGGGRNQHQGGGGGGGWGNNQWGADNNDWGNQGGGYGNSGWNDQSGGGGGGWNQGSNGGGGGWGSQGGQGGWGGNEGGQGGGYGSGGFGGYGGGQGYDQGSYGGGPMRAGGGSGRGGNSGYRPSPYGGSGGGGGGGGGGGFRGGRGGGRGGGGGFGRM